MKSGDDELKRNNCKEKEAEREGERALIEGEREGQGQEEGDRQGERERERDQMESGDDERNNCKEKEAEREGERGEREGQGQGQGQGQEQGDGQGERDFEGGTFSILQGFPVGNPGANGGGGNWIVFNKDAITPKPEDGPFDKYKISYRTMRQVGSFSFAISCDFDFCVFFSTFAHFGS